MERASCQHLTHKYPAFLGCTIGEVSLIAGIFCVLDLIVSAIFSTFAVVFFKTSFAGVFFG